MPRGSGNLEDEIVQAVDAANVVFDDPEAPLPYEPASLAAAETAVGQLAQRLASLPGTVRLLVDRARQGGGCPMSGFRGSPKLHKMLKTLAPRA